MSNEPRTRPTEQDEGKTVVGSDDERIGTVVGVEGDEIHVEVESGLPDSIAARLGWTENEGVRAIRTDEVTEITGDAVTVGPERGDVGSGGDTHGSLADESTGELATGGETEREREPPLGSVEEETVGVDRVEPGDEDPRAEQVEEGRVPTEDAAGDESSLDEEATTGSRRDTPGELGGEEDIAPDEDDLPPGPLEGEGEDEPDEETPR